MIPMFPDLVRTQTSSYVIGYFSNYVLYMSVAHFQNPEIKALRNYYLVRDKAAVVGLFARVFNASMNYLKTAQAFEATLQGRRIHRITEGVKRLYTALPHDAYQVVQQYLGLQQAKITPRLRTTSEAVLDATLLGFHTKCPFLLRLEALVAREGEQLALDELREDMPPS